MGLLDRILGKPVTQAEFVALMLKAFSQAGAGDLTGDEENFALRRQADNASIYLSNVYAEYCRVPRGDRQTLISRFVAGFAVQQGAPQDYNAARSR